MALILLLQGPNLNLLGQREPEVYGTAALGDYVDAATLAAKELGHDVEAFQTNHEGDLVDAIHGGRGRAAAIVINPGAFTHYAWSLHDALAAFDGPVVEVHISNPNAREPWRHTSVVGPVATGSITGLGIHGYELAIVAVAHLLRFPATQAARGRSFAGASSLAGSDATESAVPEPSDET